ncbi:MAG: hypothetical protein K2V38_01335 [Gemmataceae bacterium]|nr:hypothetical protein [Gemmataceae bacterium]
MLALAAGIDEKHAFDRTPVLAGALQGASCVSDDRLKHLRHDTAQARG